MPPANSNTAYSKKKHQRKRTGNAIQRGPHQVTTSGPAYVADQDRMWIDSVPIGAGVLVGSKGDLLGCSTAVVNTLTCL